ncbi:hypothetical protein ABZ942_07655 [Nocardia sp. NPDC046473]|uniref:hypothetical protein n=1 Tax=Nocardia sp. NPDC046473 TaxID=3155733 RepID=UPI0033FBBCD8
MRHRLSIIALATLGSALAWFPGAAATAAPLDSTATHMVDRALMSKQTVSVKGRLLCNGQPSTSAQSQVQLLNKRVGSDDIRRGYPANDGTFMLSLTVDDFYAIDPELHVYTGCAAAPHCTRLIKSTVPDKYINNPAPYDEGTINLEGKQANEETTC